MPFSSTASARANQSVVGGPTTVGRPLQTWEVGTVPGDPNGVLQGVAGQRHYSPDGLQAWDNIDGGTTWLPVGISTSTPTVPTMAALRLIDGGLAQVLLLGYYATGDGGGGTFVWDGTCVLADNGGTVVNPTGHVGAGRWRRLWSGMAISALCFGFRRDGTGDNRDFVPNVTGVCLEFPDGDYAFGGYFVPPGGVNWSGASAYTPILGAGATRFFLTQDSYCLISINAVQKFSASSIWFDGAGHATHATAHFPGVGSTWADSWTNCTFSGCKTTGDGSDGYVVRFDGVSQIDDLTFQRCQFIADAADGTKQCAALVLQGPNTNCLLNVFQSCSFWGGEAGFEIRAGEAKLRNCDFGGIIHTCVRAESIQLLVEGCYSESEAFFFVQTAASGPVSPWAQTVIRGNYLNAVGMGMSLNCKCNVLLEDNQCGYYVFVEPVSPDATCRVVARNNTILRPDATQLFTGPGYPGLVDEYDTTLAGSNRVICPSATPRQIVVPGTPYNVTTAANQELLHSGAESWVDHLPANPINGQVVIFKDASGDVSPTHPLTIDGNGKLIDGAASQSFTTSRVSVKMSFSTALDAWNIETAQASSTQKAADFESGTYDIPAGSATLQPIASWNMPDPSTWTPPYTSVGDVVMGVSFEVVVFSQAGTVAGTQLYSFNVRRTAGVWSLVGGIKERGGTLGDDGIPAGYAVSLIPSTTGALVDVLAMTGAAGTLSCLSLHGWLDSPTALAVVPNPPTGYITSPVPGFTATVGSPITIAGVVSRNGLDTTGRAYRAAEDLGPVTINADGTVTINGRNWAVGDVGAQTLSILFNNARGNGRTPIIAGTVTDAARAAGYTHASSFAWGAVYDAGHRYFSAGYDGADAGQLADMTAFDDTTLSIVAGALRVASIGAGGTIHGLRLGGASRIDSVTFETRLVAGGVQAIGWAATQLLNTYSGGGTFAPNPGAVGAHAVWNRSLEINLDGVQHTQATDSIVTGDLAAWHSYLATFSDADGIAFSRDGGAAYTLAGPIARDFAHYLGLGAYFTAAATIEIRNIVINGVAAVP